MSNRMETYYGLVRTPADAIKLFEACRIGILPRVQRRLSEKERQAIRPGSVFVWDEREAGMRRWTDGKSWSASRVSGSFLTYREMEGKRSSGFGAPLTSTRRTTAGRTPDSARGSDDDGDNNEPEGYRYKPDGLMKQSFSITAQNGQHLHLISYYTRPGSEQLMTPTTDPNLRSVVPPKGMYPDTTWCESGSSAVMNKAPIAVQAYLQSMHMNARPMPPHMPPYTPQYAHHHHHHHHHPYDTYPPSPIATPPYSTAPYASAPYYPHHPHMAAPPAPGHPHHPLHMSPHQSSHQPHYTTSPQYPHHHATPTPSHHVPPPPYSVAPPQSLSPYKSSVEPVRTPISEYPPPPPMHHQVSPHSHHSGGYHLGGSPHEHHSVPASSMVDPRLHATSARNPQGPLPPIGTLGGGKSGLPAPILTLSPVAPKAMPAMSPPTRSLSYSPPRSAGSAEHKGGSLSALLHREGSPQSNNTLPAIKPGPMAGAAAHDAHAINLLNKKFRV